MKLVSKTKRGKDAKGRYRSYADFECPQCGSVTEKRIDHGMKQVTCGCRGAVGVRQNHGATKNNKRTPLYSVWHGMKQRCYCKTNISYSRYGGRGVFVCDKWIYDFLEFKKWSEGNGYREGLSLDRIDNNGPYSPENCRWIASRLNSSKRFIDAHLGGHIGASECVFLFCELLDHIENSKCGVEFSYYLNRIYGALLRDISAPRRNIIQSLIDNARELQLPDSSLD